MPNVQLFITCLVDTFFPDTGEAMVNVLQRCGVSVDFPSGQTCCGQPPFNAGLARGRPLRWRNIPSRCFENATGDIVIPSGSCATMVRHSYLELFEGDPVWYPRAKALASRTYEFTEYLVDVLKVTDVGARWDGKLAYHASCHLNRHLGIDRQPRALLAAVNGAEIVELPASDDCCGFGGVFSVEHPELSAEMLKRKIGNLEIERLPHPGSGGYRLPYAHRRRIAPPGKIAESRAHRRNSRPPVRRSLCSHCPHIFTTPSTSPAARIMKRMLQSVHELVKDNLRSGGNTLLDVACGTGIHLSYLKDYFNCEGLDLDPKMLEAAQEKMPEMKFHAG